MTARCRPMAAGRALAALGWLLWGGCAATPPLLAGGLTTPAGRTDVSVGATLGGGGEPSAPLLQGRHGVSRRVDVGLTFSGLGGEVFARARAPLSRGTTRLSVLGGGGLGAVRRGEGRWAGLLDGAALLALEVGGIYEAWLGPRLLVLAGGGEPSFEPGATVGMALGFRRVHLLLEATLGARWAPGGRPQGVVRPALAVRLRL